MALARVDGGRSASGLGARTARGDVLTQERRGAGQAESQHRAAVEQVGSRLLASARRACGAHRRSSSVACAARSAPSRT